MALVAAGFVAGRGAAGAAGAGPARTAVDPARGRLPSPRRQRLLAAAGVLLAALLAAWAIWQPEAADRATGTPSRCSTEAASSTPRCARPRTRADANPLSSEPLLVQAGRSRRRPGRESATPATRSRRPS